MTKSLLPKENEAEKKGLCIHFVNANKNIKDLANDAWSKNFDIKNMGPDYSFPYFFMEAAKLDTTHNGSGFKIFQDPDGALNTLRDTLTSKERPFVEVSGIPKNWDQEDHEVEAFDHITFVFTN